MPWLVVTTDAGTRVLTSADEVMGFAGQQAEGMRAAGYDHTAGLRAAAVAIHAP